MKKDTFNNKLREFVKSTLSPTNCNGQCSKCDKCFVAAVYQSFKAVLNGHCIQIGSYPRFTAVKPLHDLDILYIVRHWDEHSHNPRSLLEICLEKITKEYSNPTNYEIKATLQTHSVTVVFKNNGEEVFSVDIVPAYIFSKNEFGQDTYKVPEVLQRKRGKQRCKFYEELSHSQKQMNWIHTDPRGYIEVAKKTNQRNSDFRKTCKFIKAWKNAYSEDNKDLELKSFHLEQIITELFKENENWEIFDAIFEFFVDLPEKIRYPKIRDRADSNKYIDQYLDDLTDKQKEKIVQARDCFLIKLENLTENDPIEKLLKPCFYERVGNTEEFLFDYKIPILTESENFRIDGFIQKKDGFRDGLLSRVDNKIAKNRKINFRITKDITYDYTMWKVQNDRTSNEVLRKNETRGEITKFSTRANPESTQYVGNHYVECFAITNDFCIARAKISVNIHT